MKTKHLLLIAMSALLGISAVTLEDDILSRLGLDESRTQSTILGNLIGDYDGGLVNSGHSENTFQVPTAKMLPSIITGDKTGAAKELCAYVRNYINSEEFMASYNTSKEQAMPLTDQEGNKLYMLKKNLETVELNIRNYPNDAPYIAEQTEYKEKYQAGIDYINETSKTDFPRRDVWEKIYPSDPEILVKKRLEEYLALVKTVDFDAKLTEPDAYNIRKFINPAYEKKDKKWKASYRAGKEVNAVVTEYVTEWLKGDIISAQKTTMTVAAAAPAEATTTDAAVLETVAATTTESAGTPAATPTPTNDSAGTPVQSKKGLLGKLKDKAKAIIKD